MNDRFLFATAPVSWGVGDYRDASWEQPYEVILDEIAGCGYTGTELGPFGYFPTNPDVLRPVLEHRGLKMLSSFVPVALADEQSPERERVAGRVPADGSKGLSVEQWRNVTSIVQAAKNVAADFGLD